MELRAKEGLGTATCPCPCLSSLSSFLDSLAASDPWVSVIDSFEVTVKCLGHRPRISNSMVGRRATGYRNAVLVLDVLDVGHADKSHPKLLPSVSHTVHNMWPPLCSDGGRSCTSKGLGALSTDPLLLQSGVGISSRPSDVLTV